MKRRTSSFTSNGEAMSGNTSAERIISEEVNEPNNEARQLNSAKKATCDYPRLTDDVGFANSVFLIIDTSLTTNETRTHHIIQDDAPTLSTPPSNLSETTQHEVDVDESIRNERTISAQHVPGGDMGYANTIQSHSRSPQDASTKTERIPSLHSANSELKEQDAGNDNHWVVDAVLRDVMSSSVETPQSPGTPDGVRPSTEGETLSGQTFGTPSTISTAPSTDEASADGTDSIGFDRATWRLDDTLYSSTLPRSTIQSIPARENAVARMPFSEGITVSTGQVFHQRRAQSWDAQEGDKSPGGHAREDNQLARYATGHAENANQDGTWEHVRSPQSRVASFRNNTGAPILGGGFSPLSPQHDGWREGPRLGEPLRGHKMRFDARSGLGYQQASYGAFPGQRNPVYGHPAALGSHTPPRPKQPGSPLYTPSRSPPTPSAGVSNPSSANLPRSSLEILKTLLRKKACLYEPETSRAVAYVTWLVGRELALEYGYFTRQQLQSGVHACVTTKIESGIITRTKVNRCMQIILNSCFHYIIPRPDGSEENGDAFRDTFAATALDDSKGVQSLSAPWDNLVVKKEFVLAAASREVSPSNSPRMASQQSIALDDVLSKRAVLLCFNENVRSAEDVFRCHNEFIRDTANASNLRLSAQEWRTFFGKDTAKMSRAWGSAGISSAVAKAEGDVMKQPDVLGRMGADELSRLRTTWCTKRYDHDHDLCAFAHVEVNGGWLRRDPLAQHYRAEMCPSIVGIADKTISPYGFVMNQCEKGTECDLAHSKEEIDYHPDRYKRKICFSSSSGNSTCPLGDICPHFHTPLTVVQGKRRVSPERRSHASPQRPASYRQWYGHGTHTGSKNLAGMPPEGSPMMYISPAPVSSFEKSLGAPGLQSLFRRHSSVVAGYLRHGERCNCFYTNFGDDWGIGAVSQPSNHATRPQREVPSVP